MDEKVMEAIEMAKNDEYSFVNGRDGDKLNVPNKQAEDWYKETLRKFIGALSDLKWSGLDIVLGENECFSLFCRARCQLQEFEDAAMDVDVVKGRDGEPKQILVVRDDEDRFPYSIHKPTMTKEGK